MERADSVFAELRYEGQWRLADSCGGRSKSAARGGVKAQRLLRKSAPL